MTLVSPLVPKIGSLPVAAFVISNSLTAEDVVWKITCSFPLASAINPASAIFGAVKVLLVKVVVEDEVTSLSAPEKLKCTPTPSVFENEPLETT